MTFTKCVALMLLGFTLFVGYRTWRDNEEHQAHCVASWLRINRDCNNPNLTNDVCKDEIHTYINTEGCPPLF